MKEEMTSFDVAALVLELDPLIKGAHIVNVYQINPVTLILKLRRSSQSPLHLLMEAGKRLHLTSYTLQKPQAPPAFCMALRKYLRNGEIKGISQHEFERIVTIETRRQEGAFKLVSELFGEGNIILVSPENRILQALAYRKMRDRNILRGEIFQHAPPSGRNPLELNRQDFKEIRELGHLEIVRALTKLLSIGGLYAEEILLRARVDKKASCVSLTDAELDGIYGALSQILSTIKTGKEKPRIIVDDKGELIDVAPLHLEKYLPFSQKTYETMNEALDEYYTAISTKAGVVEAARGVEEDLARQQRILEKQRKASEDLKGQVEKNKNIGDIIYMHFGLLESLLQKIMEEKKEGKRWEQIMSSLEEGKKTGRIPDIYLHSMEPQRLILNVSVEGNVFPLGLHRSIQINAAEYYTRAKKAGEKLKGAEKAIIDTQARIEELQQRIGRVKETRKPPAKRRKKAWYEKFRWFHSSDGFLVIGGRDSTTNEILVKKNMEPQDIVFHADILGAPFVLIKTGGKAPPEQTMKEAAQLAASYSRAWRQMLGAVDVFWVNPGQVSKSPPPGQYIKKGAFMIRGAKNYIRGVQLRIAIGVKREEEQVTVIGGPVGAIANQTNLCLEIVPGEQTSNIIAKQIRRLLTEKAPEAWKQRVSEIPLEDIQSYIPSGKGTISVSKPREPS